MENNYKSENGIGEGMFEMDKDEMENELKMIGSKDLSR